MQIPVSQGLVAGKPGQRGVVEVNPGLASMRTAIVNVAFVGGPDGWVLVDAGLYGSRHAIEMAAAARFGAGSKPAAILLTHGHFDHVGAVRALAAQWDVQVHAHPAEHPFLNGSRSYPKPRPRLQDGLISLVSPLYPRGPIDLGPRLAALPADGAVPHLPGWRWIATPGHSPGHVSFWHEESRALIAGDAVVTTAQESAAAVLGQKPELRGPPRYFTPDWEMAGDSVRRLAALRPALLVAGHGPPLGGERLADALEGLGRNFEAVAPPEPRSFA